jgi:DNA-binding NarL/FixJ family response regulator
MKTVVVEDSQVIQDWLVAVLRDIPGVEILGCAAGEPDALELIERTRPELVLLDLSLSPGHGFSVLKSLRAAGNHCKVLILTNQDIGAIGPIARELGADGVHDKNLDLAPLVALITAWVGEPPVGAGTSSSPQASVSSRL